MPGRFIALLLMAAALPAASLIDRVDSIGITVADLDRSVEFYTRVLDFKRVSEREEEGDHLERRTGIFGAHTRTARLQLGGEFIELTEFLAPRGRPAPADQRANDRWFQHIAIISSDMDQAYARLLQFHVQHASSSPQLLPAWNPNASGIRAFYFRDPDGHALEILTFPAGKGDPRWQSKASLFLGIDHTAIVVSDTEQSLRFYRDLLGMTIAGTSDNYGIEQERLNNVFGAHLRITSLRASSGPGVEFLEYLTPLDGRAYPPDEHPNDLVHFQTQVIAATSEALEPLRAARTKFVSASQAGLRQAKADTPSAIVIRDPDGHAVEMSVANTK